MRGLRGVLLVALVAVAGARPQAEPEPATTPAAPGVDTPGPEAVTDVPEAITSQVDDITSESEALTNSPEAATTTPEVVTTTPEVITTEPEAATTPETAVITTSAAATTTTVAATISVEMTTSGESTTTAEPSTATAEEEEVENEVEVDALDSLEEILTLVAEEDKVEEELLEDLEEEAEVEVTDSIMAIIDSLPSSGTAKAVKDTEDTEAIKDTEDTEDTEAIKDNVIRDIIRPAVEVARPVSLRITIQPGDTAVFKQGTVLGMSCDAYSEVDNDVEFSWTRNGRFIDTTSGHVSFESKDNGNIIIYSAGPGDEGLYQCVASNSEGVVFSRVSKVRQRKFHSAGSDRRTAGRGLKPAVWVVEPQAAWTDTMEQEDVQVVMPLSEQV